MNVRAVVVLAAVTTFAALQFGAGSADAQSVKEYSVGITQMPAPRGLTLGPDGNLWFTEELGNRVGRITPAGVVTEFSAGISANAHPGGITVGPDNNLWFVERTGNRIARMTTAGAVTEFSAGITAGALPVSIVAGPDGNLWFTESTGNRIGRITTAGVVTEFSAGITAGSAPSNIVAGPDGNLWFTESSGNRIARITTAGVVTEFSAGISANSSPNGLAVGPDGNLWFTELNGNRVGKITTAGVVTEYSAGIMAGASPRNISAGPDGNLWFTETTGNAIGQITTAGVVTEFIAGIAPAAQPWNVVTGPDGNLWFTEYTAGQIGQITTAGAVTEFHAGITPGAAPYGIAQGPDGNLWFTESATSAIGKITPLGVVTEFTAGVSVGADPVGIAAGPDGNLWFTEPLGDRIGRITPSGVVTEFFTGITSGAYPYGIVAGPDGNMWFTEFVGNRIGRITMAGVVTEFGAGITANAGPEYITAGPDGNLWFTENAGNRVGRITPLGAVTEFSAGISPGGGPRGIASGPDGNLWFTEVVGSRIGRITPLGVVTEFPVTLFSYPELIAVGPDNNMWFTEYLGNKIGRIVALPANGTVGTVSEFGAGITAIATPEGIAAGPDGNLWFTERAINRVARITPTSNFVVTNNNDSGAGSLRDAVAQANIAAGSPMITFAPAVTGTILLTSGAIQITNELTIVGPGAAILTIDGNANNRIFLILENSSPACPAQTGPIDYPVSISGLTLANAHRNSDNTGGAISTFHSLTVDSVVIRDNAAKAGAGISFLTQYSGQSLTITNSQFVNNLAMPLSVVTSNHQGGALRIAENCGGGTINTTIPVTVTIANSLFSGNRAQPVALSGQGGAIWSFAYADITISDSRVVDNHVDVPNPPVSGQTYQGGAIRGYAKSLAITRSEISDNGVFDVTASDQTRGGGLHVFNADPSLQAPADAMAIKVVDSTVSSNSVSATAGAMLVSGNVAVELDNTTVSNNSAATNRTGGILVSTGPTSPPSASNAAAPTLKMVSSILADSAATTADMSGNATTIPTFAVDATNSLIETICIPSASCSTISVVGSGNLTAVDPMLGPLVNNGGTSRTQALLTGSPAINTGTNPLALATDQRGVGYPRVIGAAADMGAYEFNPVAAPVLQSAASRKVHGSAGTFNLPLSLVVPPAINHNPTTEPRQGPGHTIVFTFDNPITSANVAITEGTATAGAPTFSGNDVMVALTGVNNQQYVTVSLTNVASAGGGTGGSGTVRIGFLTGDVNQNRVVAVSDLGLVNAQLAQTVTAANYLKDINATGTLTVADKGITNANLAKALPPP